MMDTVLHNSRQSISPLPLWLLLGLWAKSSQSQQKTTPHSTPRVKNSLVRVGLVPQHLVLTPHVDDTGEKRPPRRVTGVGVLTSNKSVEMIREKDRKVKEAAEMKQRRKEEREQKRVEKEQQRERKRKEREE